MKNGKIVLSVLQFQTWEIMRIKCLISSQNTHQEWCEQLLPSWRNTCTVEQVSSHCLAVCSAPFWICLSFQLFEQIGIISACQSAIAADHYITYPGVIAFLGVDRRKNPYSRWQCPSGSYEAPGNKAWRSPPVPSPCGAWRMPQVPWLW